MSRIRVIAFFCKVGTVTFMRRVLRICEIVCVRGSRGWYYMYRFCYVFIVLREGISLFY